MDVNLVVIAGRIAAPPELRESASGTRLLRYLVTTKADAPRRRVDVVPVVTWDPPDELVAAPGVAGMGVWISGSVQRRFWDADGGRKSRLEIIAHEIEVRERGSDSSTVS